MDFLDEITLQIKSGKGGDGHASFRREKFVPRGGPDGGNGGDGGDVIFEATDGLNTLLHFRGKKILKAQDGLPGTNRQRDGKNGEDLVLKVPLGTLICQKSTRKVLADLKEKGQRVVIARGGRGGLGNMLFKSSVNQAPEKFVPGEEGGALDLLLELKLIAHVALIGLPNAGKSTLISSLSKAKPKIADYPFTTLTPQLGVVDLGDQQSLVVADIPGLVEDASKGKGLGHKFLRHIERTKALVHLIDIASCLDEFEAMESYVTIHSELERYNPTLLSRPEIICLTKIDTLREEEIQRYVHFFEKTLQKKVLPLSAVSGHHLAKLKTLMQRAYKATQ